MRRPHVGCVEGLQAKIDVNMRTAPNGLTEIIFTTGDGVQVQETMDEVHQKMGVPSVP
jgi:hypothetical protein